MTMHLEGPWLSMQGKKKGKQKFRSAADAQRARELERDWELLKQKYKPMAISKAVKKAEPVTVVRDTEKPKSLGEWITGPVSSKQTQKYTGTKILGIGTLHKSNAVPVFSDEEAVSLASMRR